MMTPDLTTTYLGLKLPHPIVVAACPLTGEMDVLLKLEQYGAAAAVMPSLFEEQLGQPVPLPPTAGAIGPGPFLESTSYFRELKQYNRGPDDYLKHLSKAKKTVSMPLVGSLNMTCAGDGIRYAARIQEAGADALELNIYFLATDLATTSSEIEERCCHLVAAVRDQVSIPLAVKVGPFFTAFANVAQRLVASGAGGLVLFNRFLQPDIDLEAMRVAPHLTLSRPEEMRLCLRWIGLLYGRLSASLAATTGAHSADDVVKLVLAGADVVMVASTLYRHGVEVLPTLVDGLRSWLEKNDFCSLEQIKGKLSHRHWPDPAAFERANYTKAISSFLSDSQFENPSNSAS
jgi:dihydroorotate dehydrogenase (fumarate)